MAKNRHAALALRRKRRYGGRLQRGSPPLNPGNPRRSVLAGLALLLGTWNRVAAAADAALEPSTLRWVRAPGAEACPDEIEITRAVERRLGRAAFVPPDQAQLSLETIIEPVPTGGFRARITLVRGTAVVGQRELESAEQSCAALTEKVALALALTIDPEASLSDSPAEQPASEPEPLPPPLPPPPPPPPPPPVTAPPQPSPKPEHAAVQGDLEAAASVVTGIVPQLSPGFLVRGRAMLWDLPFAGELQAAYFPDKALEAAPGKGAEFALLYAGVGLCSRPPRASTLAVSACIGADFGYVVGEGFGFDYNPGFQSPLFMLGARGRLWFRPLPGLAFILGPDLSVPLVRDRFQTRSPAGTADLFRMSPVGVGFELGVVWEL